MSSMFSSNYNGYLSRTNYINSSEKNVDNLILVYLLHRQSKLPMFLTKGILSTDLSKQLYRQVCIFDKQTFSSSNAALKARVKRITGFESLDGDIAFDYRLKIGKGSLQSRKFFVPFSQQLSSSNMPFKILAQIPKTTDKSMSFLVRCFTDGNFYVLTSIKKVNLQEKEIVALKKGLTQFSTLGAQTSLPMEFSDINFMEDQDRFILITEYYPESLNDYISSSKFNSFSSLQFFISSISELFKSMYQAKISSKHLKTDKFNFDPKTEKMKIQFADTLESLLSLGYDSAFQKIDLSLYQPNLKDIISQVIGQFKGTLTQTQECLIQQLRQQIDRKYQSVDYFFQQTLNSSLITGCLQDLPNLQIDTETRIRQIAEKSTLQKPKSPRRSQNVNRIQQMHQKLQMIFCPQKKKIKNVKRPFPIIAEIKSVTSLDGQKRQKFGSIQQFKIKVCKLKGSIVQNVYIQQIINSLKEKQKFISSTKKNNLASIQFYLNNSEAGLKKKMISGIQNKYRDILLDSNYRIKVKDTGEDVSQRNSVFTLKRITSKQKKSTNPSKLRISQTCEQNDNPSFQEVAQVQDIELFEKAKYSRKIKEKKAKTIKMINLSDSMTNAERRTSKQNVLRKSCNTQNSHNDSKKANQVTFDKAVFLKTDARDLSTQPAKTRQLRELFINQKQEQRAQKVAMQRKRYDVYFKEAQKQFNTIKGCKRKRKQAVA